MPTGYGKRLRNPQTIKKPIENNLLSLVQLIEKAVQEEVKVQVAKVIKENVKVYFDEYAKH